MEAAFLCGVGSAWRGENAACQKRRRTRGVGVTALAEHSDGQVQDPVTFEPRARRNGLKSVPNVATPEEHLSKALKVAERAALDAQTKKGKSFAELQRLQNLKKVETLRTELTKRCEGYLDKFPSRASLHPYEDALIDLALVGIGLDKFGGYSGVLADVKDLKKKLNEQGKTLARGVRTAASKKDVENTKTQAFSTLESIFRKNWDTMERLKSMAKAIHRLQIANVDLPTVILAGAPNVGKSSLVRTYSSGMPEVCAYPFTTKTIIMGHFLVDGVRYQMTDTPGLLNRDEDARNTIERMTIAALRHLRSVVVFVTDLTEHCGTTVEDQLELRTRLREQFHRDGEPWIEVVSKSDLSETFKHRDLYDQAVPDSVKVSVETGENLEILQDQFTAALTEVVGEAEER